MTEPQVDDDTLASLTNVLMDAWAKAEPDHGVTKHPASYVASFVDMAKAALAADLLTIPKPDDDAIERAARALALVDDYDGCFERIDEWERTPVEDQWEIEEPGSDDYESAEDWRKKARTLAAAGLLASPVREPGIEIPTTLTADLRAAADEALQNRLSWASMHWGVERVHPEAWGPLRDVIIAATLNHLRGDRPGQAADTEGGE